MVSDTHGLLRPEVEALFTGVARILHAGDVGKPEVVERLAAVAPVTAVRGNVDRGDWAEALPETATLTLEGVRVHVLHDVAALDAAEGAAARVVVFGHSHKPLIEEAEGTLRLNPGAAGPRRFGLPVTAATLEIGGGAARARLHMLA